jgi:hypothetical protein
MPFVQLYNGVSLEHQQALAESHSVGGLCCAFAMHWIRKRLKGKVVGNDTYGDIKRLNKIAKNQQKQAGGCFSAGGQKAVAGAYGLVLNETLLYGYTPATFGGDDPHIRGAAPNVGCYYISAAGAIGHGWAVHNTGAQMLLADVGAGIYTVTDMTVAEACTRHFNLLKDAIGLTGYGIYSIGVK